MKKVLIVVLLLVFAVPSYAIEGCKKKVPYEVMGQVCYVYDFFANTKTGYNCSQPPNYTPTFETLVQQVVVKETGFKCQTLGATMVPSTWMNSAHTTSYTSLWNDLLNSTPGTSFTGPAASYNLTLDGGTSCSPLTFTTSTEYTSTGFPYTMKTWHVYETGQYCSTNVYVYGTDGE